MVSNQNLSMEMFLIRLLYLKEDEVYNGEKKSDFSGEENSNSKKSLIGVDSSSNKENSLEIKNKTVSQIKNFSQKESSKLEKKIETKLINIELKNFEELINLCNEKKELKLKYELETNVSLVNFSDQKIEISFNENLDKDFVKELTLKLYEWTGQRWIIAFSKEVGKLSKKQEIEVKKSKIIEDTKGSDVYKKIIDLFPDAELVDVKSKDDE